MSKIIRKKHLTSFQLIILGFAGVILFGTILLMFPISTLENVPTPFSEALFTATSAVCVTGLVVKDTGSYWSVFGHNRRAISGYPSLSSSDGYSCAYTNRRIGSSNRGGSGFSSFRKKNISYAKKYNTGCNFST